MSAIPRLIAAIAFLYALVVLFIVLKYWTSQVVEGSMEFSVRLYRLLLTAYPAPFRNEYGEAMVQLFRDTVRDAYRRRGLLGVAAVWPRTLADLTSSVIRQHRDRPVIVSSESVLLRDLLHKWRRLGSDALSVIAFSTWYTWHLLRLYYRRTLFVWATLTAVAFGVWFASFFDSFNWMKGRGTRVDIGGGTVQICHVYEVEEPVSDEEWLSDIRTWNQKNRSVTERFNSPARPWEFSYLTDIPGAITIQWRNTAPDHRGNVRPEPVLVRPYKSWRLRFPFGILPLLLLVWTIRVYLRKNANSVAAMQSA